MHISKWITWTCFACCLIVTTPSQAENSSPELKYNLKEGKEYSYKINFTIHQLIGSNRDEYTYKFTALTKLTAEKKKKSYDCLLHFEDVTFECINNKDDNTVIYEPKNYDDLKASFKLGTDGKLTKLKGFDAFKAPLAKAVKKDQLLRREMRKLIDKPFWDKMIPFYFYGIAQKNQKNVKVTPPYPFTEKKIPLWFSAEEEKEFQKTPCYEFTYDIPEKEKKKRKRTHPDVKMSINGSVALSKDGQPISTTFNFTWEKIPVTQGHNPVEEQQISIKGELLYIKDKEENEEEKPPLSSK